MSDDTTEFMVVPLNPLVNEGFPDRLAAEKKLIRDKILGATNEEIKVSSELMDEICALGSDLNINAFACNFKRRVLDGYDDNEGGEPIPKYRWEANDDVEEGKCDIS